MSTLVVLGFDGIHTADDVLNKVRSLQKQYLIDLEDACVVVKDEAGNIKLHQSVNLTATGAVSGALWGTLIGLLFFNPFLGTALGAATGALAGRLNDYGIDDDFIKSLAAEMQLSSSAIFALVRRATVDKVEPEVAKFGGKLLHTSLSKEAEAKFQAMLDEANKSA